MASTIQVRVVDDLKMKAEALFKDLGIDTTTAIRMFLAQAVAIDGLPFAVKRVSASPYSALTEKEVLEKLEKARNHASEGRYVDAEDVSNDLREKYGI